MKLNLRAVLLSIALCTLGSSAIPTKHGLFEKRDDYGISYEEPHKDYFTPITHLSFTEKPVTRHYELELTQEKISPDGFEKIGFVVNGQYPGPILLANKGDRMVIKVVNKLGAKSTLHWHGMRQYQTPWFDGSANGVTQCPIPDEETFVYDFSTEYQSGTYWYHGHFRGQYINGLRGVFVIHDPEDPYLNAYDDEYVLTLSEIYHALAEDLVRQRLAPGYKGFNPVADSGVISGRGRYKCSAAPKGSKCDSDAPLAEYKVQKGKRYRLRLINSSANSLFTFSIDNHQMKVIEADGVYTKELLVNKLPINIGQRYSVLIEANQPVDNYQIRATIAKECLLINNATINANSAIDFKVVGVLKYEGAGDKEPTSVEFPDQPPPCSDLPPNSLVPFFPEPKLGPADKTFYMNVTFQLTPQQVVLAFINDNSFVPDYYNPTLQKVIDGVDPNTLPPNQNAFIFDKPDESIELRIFNSNRAEHPFHMHGHNFSILGVGTGPKIIESQLNLVNPTIRDIVTAPPYGWLVLRFPANNPGVWSFHCHIEWHVEVGFSAQLVELPGQVSEFKLPEAVKNLCPKS